MFAIAIFIFLSIVFIVGGVVIYSLCQASARSNKEYEDEYQDPENYGF